jgi:hypothetical protein
MDLRQLRSIDFAIDVQDKLFSLSHISNARKSKATQRTKYCTALRVKDFRLKCHVNND